MLSRPHAAVAAGIKNIIARYRHTDGMNCESSDGTEHYGLARHSATYKCNVTSVDGW